MSSAMQRRIFAPIVLLSLGAATHHLPVRAQDLVGCSKADYRSEILIALTDDESTSVVHRAWYSQCLTTDLDRGRYLDQFLETAIDEFTEWQTGILQTGDEVFLAPETEAARDALGHAFSDAVERANTQCIDQDDWRIAERAISWWGRSAQYDLDDSRYGLDEATFLERLCTKIHFDISNDDGPRIGYDRYTFAFRIGVRLGENDPHFDIPLALQEPMIEGGVVVEDTTIDEAFIEALNQQVAELESQLAAIESMGSDPELAPIFEAQTALIETISEALVAAPESLGVRTLSIAPDNTDEGLSVALAASIVDIPIVQGQYRHAAEQNPYWGSRWRFMITADAIVVANNGAQWAEFAHRAGGTFGFVWPKPEEAESSGSLKRTFSNYVNQVTWNDYEQELIGSRYRCENYFSPTFLIDGKPRWNLDDDSEYVSAPGIWPPYSLFEAIPYSPNTPLIRGNASDPETIPWVYLQPMYIADDGSFEYSVDCYRSGPRGIEHFESQRTFYLDETFQALIPLESVTTTGDFSQNSPGSNTDWVLTAELECLSDCPSEEELAPPQTPLVPTTEPPAEPDVCQPEHVRQQCEADLRSVMLQCSEFEDWQVTIEESGAPAPRSYCADLDCAGAGARSDANSEADIFTTISHETDAVCTDMPDTACSVMCLGYR